MKGEPMNESQKTETPARPHAQRARPTIGFLVENVWSHVSMYTAVLWAGVSDAAREREANLICFAGGWLGVSPYDEFNAQRNVLYDLATSDSVDGLVISSGALGLFVSPQELQAFCDRYRPLPMVSIALALKGISSVLGITSPAYATRSTTSSRPTAVSASPASVGLKATRRPMHGIAPTPRRWPRMALPSILISSHLAPSPAPQAMAAMRVLLGRAQTAAGVDFQAVVAATDSMALGAVDVLQARGVQIPYDVAVVGFDNVAEARVSTPALTTVRQPIYEQGKRAVEMLLALLAGEDVPEQVVLPTEMVVRRSCGCHSQAVLQAAAEPAAIAKVSRGAQRARHWRRRSSHSRRRSWRRWRRQWPPTPARPLLRRRPNGPGKCWMASPPR